MANVGNITVGLELDTSQFNSQMSNVSNSLSGIGDALTNIGNKLTTTVTLPLIGLGVVSVKTAADFEQSMSKVEAISGTTGEELISLTELARKMGKETKFSANEAAEAMKFMAMAGWDAGEITEGLAGVMDLAAASGEDLALVSDIVTDAMTAFKLESSETQRFVDLLAKTASSSNTNIKIGCPNSSGSRDISSSTCKMCCSMVRLSASGYATRL